MTRRQGLIAVAIFFLAMNLRSSFLAVTPLLESLSATYHLDGSQLGLLTAIPLFVFAVLSPFAGTIGARWGVGRVMVYSIIVMGLGVLLRYFLGLPGLYIGTLVLAIGIVAGNVLLPAVVGAFFPKQINLMTCTYTSLMQVTTGLALATIGPLALWWGWQQALLFWSWPLLVAFLLWLPLYRLDIACPESLLGEMSRRVRWRPLPAGWRWVRPTIRTVFSYPLAWDVSLYMGLQSLCFFSISTWFPSMLTSSGIPESQAGTYLAVFQITSLITTFLLPLLTKKSRSQSGMASGLCLMLGLGIIMTAFITGPWMALATAVVLGVSAGGVFVIAMLFFILRATTPEQSAVLAGVGQAMGYLLASTMPVCLGYLHDLTGTWTAAQVVLFAWTLLFAWLGLRAGRDAKIPQAQEPSGWQVRKMHLTRTDVAARRAQQETRRKSGDMT